MADHDCHITLCSGETLNEQSSRCLRPLAGIPLHHPPPLEGKALWIVSDGTTIKIFRGPANPRTLWAAQQAQLIVELPGSSRELREAGYEEVADGSWDLDFLADGLEP